MSGRSPVEEDEHQAAGGSRSRSPREETRRSQQTDEQVTSWRQKREVKHLERRADRAEEYAVNAVVIAMIDADEAEIAVLDALDARLDADTASA